MELTEEQLNALHALPLEGWKEMKNSDQGVAVYSSLLHAGLVDVKDQEGGGYSAVQITDLGKIHLRRHMLR